jgi:hypothetical protein
VGGLIADTTKSHDVARDELARHALELGQAVSLMVTAALKKEAATLANAAGTIFICYCCFILFVCLFVFLKGVTC